MKKLFHNMLLGGSLLVILGSAIAQPISWERIASPIGGSSLAMTFSPANGRVWSGNGYYTSDNGTTWVAKPNGIVPGVGSHFTMTINDKGYLFTGNFTGPYRSTDGGDNWTPLFISGWPGIASLTTHFDEVWAGSYKGKIYHSTDNGTTWTMAHDSDDFDADIMAMLAFGQTVYAGTYGDGIVRSGDNGKTWTKLDNGISHAGIVCLCTTDGTTMNLLAGTNGSIFYSGDGGDTWGERIDLGSVVYALTPNPLTGVIYAATDRGVYRSVGPLGSWSASNAGLTTFNIRSITVDKNTGYIYAGTLSDGVFRSTNNGDAWEQVGTPVPVWALANADGRIIAGTNDSIFASSGGAFTQSNTNITTSVCTMLYADVLSPARVFAGTWNGMYRSDDRGMTWQLANEGITGGSIFLFNDMICTSPDNLFAATGNGLYRSTDLGGSWISVLNEYINAVAFDAVGTYMYATSSFNGIYRADNVSGTGWQPKNTGLPGDEVLSLVLHPLSGTLLAGVNNQGIYRSTDHGDSWTKSNSPIVSSVKRMIVADNGAIFAATLGEGMYASTDDGLSWKAVNTGLESINIYSLAFDNEGYLLAGTRDAGMFRSVTSFSGVRRDDPSISSMRVYPNPAAEKISIDAEGSGILEVFDACGNMVLSHEVHIGNNEITVKDIPVGAYSLRFTSAEKTMAANIVVMR